MTTPQIASTLRIENTTYENQVRDFNISYHNNPVEVTGMGAEYREFVPRQISSEINFSTSSLDMIDALRLAFHSGAQFNIQIEIDGGAASFDCQITGMNINATNEDGIIGEFTASVTGPINISDGNEERGSSWEVGADQGFATGGWASDPLDGGEPIVTVEYTDPFEEKKPKKTKNSLDKPNKVVVKRRIEK